MRRICFALITLLVATCILGLGSSAGTVAVRGDYVEVRTASVFAGGCHFNGEITTTGREALMAWSISSGKWNDVDLSGIRAVAIVSSGSNLAETDATRQSRIIVDSSASHTQAVALVAALKTNYGVALGNVVAIFSAPINFDRAGKNYAVTAGSFASIDVEPMPNDLCCKMPNLVWYSPLVPLSNRKVGYTANATYAGDNITAPWQSSGDNSAFYGSFAF